MGDLVNCTDQVTNCSVYHAVVSTSCPVSTRALGSSKARVLHYVIHGPQPAAGETLALTRRETAAKRHAIEAYRSQTLVIGDFLRAFETGRERFVEGEPWPQPACWCRGENLATP